VPIREFRVDDYGAPRYPELVLVTTRDRLEAEGDTIASVVAGLREGYALAARDPSRALDDMVERVPNLDRDTTAAQLEALDGSFTPPLRLDRPTLERWARYAARYGIVRRPPDVGASFDFGLAP
jgi:NitT/TauT family transport system substrate-binding protein/putative hydroxymethylpyrimidine transport system substrate-binding protein